MASEARTRAVLEGLAHCELVDVLASLSSAGVRPLVMKGAALGYTHYSSPSLRPRGDADLLIPGHAWDETARCLRALGYHRSGQNLASGPHQLISYQCTFRKQDRFGANHTLDVHWKISNVQAFAHALSYEELEANAIPIVPFGRHARTLSPVHALFLACMHRTAHIHSPFYDDDGVPVYAGDHLLWVYDVHLLARDMTAEQWVELAQLARDKRLCGVLLSGLTAARQAFGTVLPPDAMDTLAAAQPDDGLQLRQLAGSSWLRVFSDFQALPTWRQRIVLFKEYSFPSSEYLRQKYCTDRQWLLPFLYLRRAIEGVWKRTVRGGFW